jgi:N,N-dimethylformamidase
MSNDIRHGTVNDARICAPIEGVRIRVLAPGGQLVYEATSDTHGAWALPAAPSRVTFAADGYVEKSFSSDLPAVVRLLEDCLIGYHNKLWFKPGENVTAHIHSPVPYSAVLYRHGLDKTVVADYGDRPEKCQNVPDGYFVEDGLEWYGSLSYTVPENARPGLYSLLLTAPGQEDFAIPLIVSTPAEKRGKDSRLLVLASTNTWQSYNLWGGRSRYRNFEDGNSADFANVSPAVARLVSTVKRIIPAPAVKFLRRCLGLRKPGPGPWAFKRLGIRRPFTNCALEDATPAEPFTNHLGGGEWRVLAWLEREQIAYDFVSGFELHQTPEMLQHYDAVLFSTHCEYWTKEMYEGLRRRFKNAGLWILNVSGNTMFRQIEFYDDGASRCVSLDFARDCADESQLLGVRFTMSDYGTCAPFCVVDKDHWAFDGIASDTAELVFGESSLNRNTEKKSNRYDPGRPGMKGGLAGNGASGWETDKLTDTAAPDFKVIAKGMNDHGGADMVIREADGGRGGVFSASSVTFGGALLIDETCSTILRNVIEKALRTKPPVILGNHR